MAIYNGNNKVSIPGLVAIFNGEESIYKKEVSEYFYVEALADSSSIKMFGTNSQWVTYNVDLKYSIDNKATWNTYTLGTTISRQNGERVYFKGYNLTTFSQSTSDYIKVTSDKNFSVGGDIMSLVADGIAYKVIPSSNFFHGMFFENTKLISISNLILSATTLAINCYRSMFEGCTGLTSIPTSLLPATTLENCNFCYTSMFATCSNIVNACCLPATIASRGCYWNMFYGCTKLVTVPALPATVLDTWAYQGMFNDCTSLKVYSASGTGYDKVWRIPTSGTATGTTAFDNLFYNTIGDYTTATSVDINQTFYTQNEPV